MSSPDRRRVAGLAGLWLVAAALAAFGLTREIAPHDEGLMLQAARRMADGQWPWRDFWWNYGPGQPLLLAVGVEAFGPSLLTWRILRVLLAGVAAVLVYVLVRRQIERGPALLTFVAAAGALAWPAQPGPNASLIVLALGAQVLAERRPGVAGGLAGLAVLFRPDMGLFVVLATLLAARRPVRALAGAAVVTLLAWLPFVIAGGGDLVDDLVGFAGIQGRQRLPVSLNYGGSVLDLNKVFEFYFPVLLLAGFAVWVVVAIRARPPRTALGPLALSVAGLLYLLGRADEFHFAPLSVVLPVLCAVLAGHGRVGRAGRVALLGVIAVVAAHGLDRRAGQALNPPELAPLDLPVADGVRVSPEDARALPELAAWVWDRVPEGRPVFVANPRFDRVRVGDPLLYVLLDRPNPTRYDVMQPGLVTTREVQEEMVADLERAQPEVVVRWLDPTATAPEPNESAESSGVRVLDEYIESNYRPARRFGPDYATLVRR